MVSINKLEAIDPKFRDLLHRTPDSDVPVVCRSGLNELIRTVHFKDLKVQQRIVDQLKERIAIYENNLEEANKFFESVVPQQELEEIREDLTESFLSGDLDAFKSGIDQLRERGVKQESLNQFFSALLFRSLDQGLDARSYEALSSEVKGKEGENIYFNLAKDLKAEEIFKKIVASEERLGTQLTNQILGRMDPQAYKNLLYVLCSKKFKESNELATQDRRLLDRILPVAQHIDKLMDFSYAVLATNASHNKLLVEAVERFVSEKLLKSMPIERGTSH